jgi:hypothetical protein
MLKESGRSAFVYESSTAGDLAVSMNLQLTQVKKALLVYRIYHQLQNLGYEVRSDHYSLIEIAVSQRLLADEFFGLDRRTFVLSREGAERFVRLCAQQGCAVTNPGSFRVFANVYRNGTERDVEQILSGHDTVDDVWHRVSNRMERRTAVTTLEKARDLLESIELDEIRGTKNELKEIERIRKLLENKLTPAHEARAEVDELSSET